MGSGIKRRGRTIAALLGLALAAGLVTVATPAHASFPGVNGLIAYTDAASGNVHVVNPTNPVPTQVTNTGGFNEVSYNAAGNKIVAAGPAGLVLVDPVAGSSVTVVPNTTSDDDAPAFDPTGSKIVFENTDTLVTIDVAGTNRTTIVSGGADNPDWSADGTFIAFQGPGDDTIERVSPSGTNRIVLATRGPAGTVLCTAANCEEPTVSPDNTKVIFDQEGVGNGLAQVNSNGTTATPLRITTAAGGDDDNASYSPDGTKAAFERNDVTLATVPTDGSTTVTSIFPVGDVLDLSWGRAVGTGPVGSVISVSATRNGANCVFSITATPAAAGITVDFSITSKKGVEKLAGNDVAVPASPSVKARKKGKNKVRIITLSDPKGATLGTSTATCQK